MSWAVLVLALVPFTAAALSLLVGHRGEAAVRGIAVGGSLLGLALALGVALPHLGDAEPLTHVFAATAAAGPPIELSFHVDQLSAVMLLLAHTVACLVQIYSLGYMEGDPRYPSYAALVSLFTGAMTLVVTADDLWVLLIGWELMGACSYFLISHHWELPEARAGAVKAFLLTRTADLGLLFGIIVLGIRFDGYRISTIMAEISGGGFGRDDLWLPAILLTVAVLGKSSQFPFHTWLPDAMPGPTPISALIHAATMVAAGVFLVARAFPLFLSAPAALTVLALVAALTMFVSAVYALFTHDLKRVLAWSTVSQLAYMFGALAVGSYAAGVLHLLAHGAFKALLFLAAGSVVHAVGTTSMSAMGGLRDKLPDTFLTMTFGFAALAGVVPLVGFFTKDAVIGAAWEAARHGHLVWPWVSWVLLVSAVVTALLTVAYSLRAWLLVFFTPSGVSASAAPGTAGGLAPSSLLRHPAAPPSAASAELAHGQAADTASAEETGGFEVGALLQPVPEPGTPAAREPHEAGWSMRTPLYLLSIPTVLGGLVVVYPEVVFGEGEYDLLHPWMAVLMTVLVALTAALVVWQWRRGEGRDPWHPYALPHPAIDRVYQVGVVTPVHWLARLVRAGDRDVIDGYADGAGALTRGVGWVLRRAQTGDVQTYLVVVVVGACAVAVAAGVAA